ncbi:MAG TPA: response regulator transcription factor [Candidatus Acidoferrales bacterium]|nr:response regulator transcription factor [Candidatus Acidoferrales bacterium]
MTAHTVKVLLVEDAEPLVTRLSEILMDIPGLELVGPARSVTETIRIAPLIDPDALVLDLQIEDGTGLDVLRVVRAKCKGTTVIVLTNSASDFVRHACLKAGANYFMDKSNELEKLREVLARMAHKLDPPRAVAAAGRRLPRRAKS